jgi:hypothetical protein
LERVPQWLIAALQISVTDAMGRPLAEAGERLRRSRSARPARFRMDTHVDTPSVRLHTAGPASRLRAKPFARRPRSKPRNRGYRPVPHPATARAPP